MGRPRTDTVDYFPHYVMPSNTLEIIESQFKNDGYTFFYKLLTKLAYEDGYFYDARSVKAMKLLAAKCSVTIELATEILDALADMKKIDPYLWKHGIIWYSGFVQSLKEVYRSRKRELPTIENVYEKAGVSPGKTLVSPGETLVLPRETNPYYDKKYGGVSPGETERNPSFTERNTTSDVVSLGETLVSPRETPTSKVKESIVEESKVKEQQQLLHDNFENEKTDNEELIDEIFNIRQIKATLKGDPIENVSVYKKRIRDGIDNGETKVADLREELEIWDLKKAKQIKQKKIVIEIEKKAGEQQRKEDIVKKYLEGLADSELIGLRQQAKSELSEDWRQKNPDKATPKFSNLEISCRIKKIVTKDVLEDIVV